MSRPLTPERYYRLPWSLGDNAIVWLEPTTLCNLACRGCYRTPDPQGHRPLEELKADLLALQKLRRCDGVSIAGGEPLLYPRLPELVAFIVAQGWKAVVNTNGLLLTPERVAELARAGLTGFTVHVDSGQVRPGWAGADEAALNGLRLTLARLIHSAGRGRLSCAFNATIYRGSLAQVPDLVRWAQAHADLVQAMVFILFRSGRAEPGFQAWAGPAPVDPAGLPYALDPPGETPFLIAQEVVDRIRTADPAYEPCAFLGGTEEPRSTKWLLALRLADEAGLLGYLDGRFVELAQAGHHLLHGTYLAYVRPWVTRCAPAWLAAALVSPAARRAALAWLGHPRRWLKRPRLQSLALIQPGDILPDGRVDMCDGCPDALYHDGRLVWSCRLEEIKRFGRFVELRPKSRAG